MSLEGRLEDMGLADIFQIIGLSKRSGVLTLIRKEGTGRLVFNQGMVIFGSSDTRSRLGYTLVKKGFISNEDLEYALRVQTGRGAQKPIGTILLEMGALDQPTFEKELRLHIILVVHDLLSWDSGSFHFQLGAIPQEKVAASEGFSTETLLLEAMKMKDELDREQQAKSEPVKTPAVEEAEPDPFPNQEVEAALAKPPASGPENFPERKDLRLLSTMISELSKPNGTTELTLMILRFASEIMNRAVVFLVRKEDIVGLGQFGLQLPDGDEEKKVKSIKIPLSEPSVFKGVSENKAVYKGGLEENKWHQHLIDNLGKEWPSEVFIVPIVCEDVVVAILYGDNLPDKKPIHETEGLEAFIKVTEIAFSKALLERKFQKTSNLPF